MLLSKTHSLFEEPLEEPLEELSEELSEDSLLVEQFANNTLSINNKIVFFIIVFLD
jgi:hypothetical protein